MKAFGVVLTGIPHGPFGPGGGIVVVAISHGLRGGMLLEAAMISGEGEGDSVVDACSILPGLGEGDNITAVIDGVGAKSPNTAVANAESTTGASIAA